MDTEPAGLKRQIEEIKNLIKEEQERVAEAKRRRKNALQILEPNSLYGLLDACQSLSQAIQVETNPRLLARGNSRKPVKRLFPKRILPWEDFPRLQERIWEKLDSKPTFTSQRLFASNHQLEYVHGIVKKIPIYSDASLRDFQRDTVDDFVEKIIDALLQNEILRSSFSLEGRVAFEDRANPEDPIETSFEEEMGKLCVNNHPSSLRRQTRSRGTQRTGINTQGPCIGRRRHRRADQVCLQVVDGERRIPAYAVEYKAPHKLFLAELTAGLHEIEPARDIIDKDGHTFEFHATRLVATVVTQLFSYMIDSGLQNGYICTGEAFVFLHIPEDPTQVFYHLCVPNQDVLPDEECRLHRTAVGQVLAFTLNALAADPPPQEWHDKAQKKLSTWKVEYLDVLEDIPLSVRKDPPSSEYKPSSWKSISRSPCNTFSRNRYQPDQTTPEKSLGETSSNGELPSQSHATHTLSGIARGPGGSGGRGRGQSVREQSQSAGFRGSKSITRQYCTMKCMHGLASRDRLDPECPNFQEHGTGSHALGPRELIRRLHAQILQDRHSGFEQLHICGRTGYLLKASLLSHGYTFVIKATTAQREHSLRAENIAYSRLRPLQGSQIPVCIGHFKPRIPYWYHGEIMTDMMILSWSGIRVQKIISKENVPFFDSERSRLVKVLRAHGVFHRDNELRNILWDGKSGHAIMIDFEEVSWLKEPTSLVSTSANIARKHLRHERETARKNAMESRSSLSA